MQHNGGENKRETYFPQESFNCECGGYEKKKDFALLINSLRRREQKQSKTQFIFVPKMGDSQSSKQLSLFALCHWREFQKKSVAR